MNNTYFYYCGSLPPQEECEGIYIIAYNDVEKLLVVNKSNAYEWLQTIKSWKQFLIVNPDPLDATAHCLSGRYVSLQQYRNAIDEGFRTETNSFKISARDKRCELFQAYKKTYN